MDNLDPLGKKFVKEDFDFLKRQEELEKEQTKRYEVIAQEMLDVLMKHSVVRNEMLSILQNIGAKLDKVIGASLIKDLLELKNGKNL